MKTFNKQDAVGKIDWYASPSQRSTCELVEAAFARRHGVEIVKAGSHRCVYRISLDEGVFYLKEQPVRGWKSKLSLSVRKSSAEREFIVGMKLKEIGMPLPSVCGWGERKVGGSVVYHYFLTRAIPETMPLDELTGHLAQRPDALWLEENLLRRSVISQIAEIAARLHAHGFVHDDFHAGNLLLQHHAVSGGQACVYLIDLASIRQVGKASDEQRWKNLGQLYHTFSLSIREFDVVRFWRAYQREWSTLTGENHGQLDGRMQRERVFRDVVSWRRSARVKGDRKWARGNRRLLVMDQGWCCARGLSHCQSEHVQSLVTHPGQLIVGAGIVPVKLSEDRVVVKRVIDQMGPGGTSASVFVKKLSTPWRRFWGAKLLGIYSRAQRTWEFGHAMRRRGIGTPLPILFVEQAQSARWLSRVSEYLVTKDAEGLVPLAPFLRFLLVKMSAEDQSRWCRKYAELLGEAMARLHEAGFDHRDLKAMNWLVAEEPSRTEYQLLDLDAVRWWWILPRRQRMKNIARLKASVDESTRFSKTLCLRFLRAYSQTWDELHGHVVYEGLKKRRWKSDWLSVESLSKRYSKDAGQQKLLNVLVETDVDECCEEKRIAA